MLHMLSNIMQFISVQSCAEHVSTIQCIHCQCMYLQLQDTSEIKDYFCYCNKDFCIVSDKVFVDVIEWITMVRI